MAGVDRHEITLVIRNQTQMIYDLGVAREGGAPERAPAVWAHRTTAQMGRDAAELLAKDIVEEPESA